jgi:hypothetical protein
VSPTCTSSSRQARARSRRIFAGSRSAVVTARPPGSCHEASRGAAQDPGALAALGREAEGSFGGRRGLGDAGAIAFGGGGSARRWMSSWSWWMGCAVGVGTVTAVC